VSCPHIDPTVFSWYKRVLPGCRLYLVLTYCDSWPGCVCIVRSDFYLPVEMVGFSAAAGDGRVMLNWATASETNTSRFMITRAESPDGMYAPVHYEAAMGNSSARHDYVWVDEGVENNRTYYYKLHVQDQDGSYHYYNVDGNVVVASATPRTGAELPFEFALYQNYPNPFNPQTTFSFTIPAADHVTLKVFDMLGREVATVVDENLAANHYTFNWSADGLPTGVYLYTLKSGNHTATNKLLYLK